MGERENMLLSDEKDVKTERRGVGAAE